MLSIGERMKKKTANGLNGLPTLVYRGYSNGFYSRQVLDQTMVNTRMFQARLESSMHRRISASRWRPPKRAAGGHGWNWERRLTGVGDVSSQMAAELERMSAHRCDLRLQSAAAGPGESQHRWCSSASIWTKLVATGIKKRRPWVQK